MVQIIKGKNIIKKGMVQIIRNKDNKERKRYNKERNGAGANWPSPRGGIWAGCQPWLSHQVPDHPQSESGFRLL